MQFFELRADANNFANLGFSKEGDWKVIYDFDGRSLQSTWQPVQVRILDDSLPVGDLLSFHSHIPVLTERAVSCLEDIIKPNCEILELACSTTKCFALNVKTTVNALDRNRSEIVYFSNGKILDLKRAHFDSRKLGGIDIFKLPDLPLGKVFVSTKFVEMVNANNLKGFVFEEHPASAVEGSAD